MKWKAFFWCIVVSGLAVYVLLVRPVRVSEEKKRRAELHLLNTIQGQIQAHLDSGGELPASWAGLSNAVDWKLVAGICEYNQLPPPEELYTLLPHPIDFDSYHR